MINISVRLTIPVEICLYSANQNGRYAINKLLASPPYMLKFLSLFGLSKRKFCGYTLHCFFKKISNSRKNWIFSKGFRN